MLPEITPDNPSPKLLDQVRIRIPAKHYSQQTEKRVASVELA